MASHRYALFRSKVSDCVWASIESLPDNTEPAPGLEEKIQKTVELMNSNKLWAELKAFLRTGNGKLIDITQTGDGRFVGILKTSSDLGMADSLNQTCRDCCFSR